ncbi:hypothetical protein TUM19329_19210 [Legionella antarctica]|uniref:Uncharacterized protein n=1 Tax=Legionella antarctica TaxID=2708020 RepID=A0A6F8T5Y3_9GAMM|nr:hypothetical protein [Legionella antarctica]BCA95560.1 hypothetical protein TUM19329_19210 [Legionella antarctica]
MRALTYSAFPILDSISTERIININIDPNQVESIDEMSLPPVNLELGGMSGAPIFVIKQDTIDTWELCGVVTRSIFENTNFGGTIINNELFNSLSIL